MKKNPKSVQSIKVRNPMEENTKSARDIKVTIEWKEILKMWRILT